MEKKRQMSIKTYRKIIESEFKFWTEERERTLRKLMQASEKEEREKYKAQIEILPIACINLKHILDSIDLTDEAN